MKKPKLRILAAKMSLVFVLGTGAVGTLNQPAHAGIPVIDAVGLVQHIMNALQSIQQTMQMITSYQTQLMQLENQIKNTLNPGAFLWDQANLTINGLLNQIDTISHFKTQFGSIDSYLDKFKDFDHYKNAPCLRNGCSVVDMEAFVANVKADDEVKAEAVKASNDAMIKGLDEQQEQLQRDADRLRDLQANAMTAEGQLEAIQHANQLASSQAAQLLQIRGLMMSQQSALAANSQKTESDDAKRKAIWQKIMTTERTPATPDRVTF